MFAACRDGRSRVGLKIHGEIISDPRPHEVQRPGINRRAKQSRAHCTRSGPVRMKHALIGQERLTLVVMSLGRMWMTKVPLDDDAGYAHPSPRPPLRVYLPPFWVKIF